MNQYKELKGNYSNIRLYVHSVKYTVYICEKRKYLILLGSTRLFTNFSRFWFLCWGPLVFLLSKVLKLFGFQILWLCAYEGYSRKASCGLNLISTFLFKKYNTWVQKNRNTNNMMKSPESSMKTTTCLRIRQITIIMVEWITDVMGE